MDRQTVASKAGVLLEELLQHVAGIFECSLPLREVPKYALGELASSTRKVLRVAVVQKLLRDGDGVPEGNPDDPAAWESVEIKPLFERVEAYTEVRNEVGAHYSVNGLDIPDREVEAFAQSALALARGLSCPVCGEVPQKVRDGTYRGCGCREHRTRLTPVQRP